jgi:UDP-glucuronate decarboxylase
MFIPLSEDDPLQRQPDITLPKAKPGWQRYIKLKEGLNQAIRACNSFFE